MPRRPGNVTRRKPQWERMGADLQERLAAVRDEEQNLVAMRDHLLYRLFHEHGYTHVALAAVFSANLPEGYRLSEDAVEKAILRERRRMMRTGMTA